MSTFLPLRYINRHDQIRLDSSEGKKEGNGISKSKLSWNFSIELMLGNFVKTCWKKEVLDILNE